ncbi:coiled-coil domain-containing protein 158-like [Ambystoma mexicanum]|uniref:coiled-coil domain-containing protein 158-like n=1 Tax=Ambystoma mexicanum TaxID=8296 RepID=UPI0037E75F49
MWKLYRELHGTNPPPREVRDSYATREPEAPEDYSVRAVSNLPPPLCREDMLKEIRALEWEAERLKPQYIEKVEKIKKEYHRYRRSGLKKKIELQRMEIQFNECVKSHNALEDEITSLKEQNAEYSEKVDEMENVSTDIAQQYNSLHAELTGKLNILARAEQYLKGANQQKLDEMTTALNRIKTEMQRAKTELRKTHETHKIRTDSNGEVIAIARLQEQVVTERQKVSELTEQVRSLENGITAASEEVNTTTNRKTQLQEQLNNTITAKEKALAKMDCLANEKAIKEELVSLANISDTAIFYFTVCEELVRRHEKLLDARYGEDEDLVAGAAHGEGPIT